jgi:hypothetical protein
MILTFLCYDYFGYTTAKYGRDDADFVTAHFGRWSFLSALAKRCGATISPEVFLEIYESALRTTDDTDRKRLRRQGKLDTLTVFRNEFHR